MKHAKQLTSRIAERARALSNTSNKEDVHELGEQAGIYWT